MQSKLPPGRHGAAREIPPAGLTLIELVVVLAILSALAGLVSAFFPDLIQRTGCAIGGASLMDLMKALERHRARLGQFPDGYDSLIEAPYTLYSAIPAAARRQLKPKDLDNSDRLILRANGIQTAWMHVPPNGEAVTWQALSATKALDVNAGGFAADDVAALDTTRINPDLLFGPGTTRGTINESFVMFGIGERCTLVGVGAELAQAPIAPVTSAALDPGDRYMRLALVFRLDRDDRTPFRFLGAVGFSETGIATASDLSRKWWAK